MVNSYLTVAVEVGLPLFALILAAALLPVARCLGGAGPLGPPQHPRVSDLIRLAALASWATWLACLVFSNLWIIGGLWIVPSVAAVALLALRPHSAAAWSRALAGAGVSALLACLALWLAGSAWATREPIQIRRTPDGSVSLSVPASTPTQPHGSTRQALVWIVPDAEVLGESYGQELRRWLLADTRLSELRVFTSVENLSLQESTTASAVLLCGAATAHAGAPGLASGARAVWLLHPTVPPPAETPAWPPASRVILQGIDVAGQAAAWWPWAAQSAEPLTVILSNGLATDVRSRWPEMALAWPLPEPK